MVILAYCKGKNVSARLRLTIFISCLLVLASGVIQGYKAEVGAGGDWRWLPLLKSVVVANARFDIHNCGELQLLRRLFRGFDR